MPHLKCDPCRVRLDGPQGQPPFFSDACPECGATLQPAGDLRSIVGYRAVGANWAGGGIRWADDGGNVAQAVALPVPDPR